jgi:hypothetical protein
VPDRLEPPSTPPGWFPDGDGGLRWWDGEAWTPHRAVPIRVRPAQRRRGLLGVGIAMLACAPLTLAVGGLMLMGDPFPISRVGVIRDGDAVVVVNGVCPGERLESVTLARRAEDGRSEALWRIEGDAPMVGRLLVGSVPEGMSATTPLSELPGDDTPLVLSVVTDELTNPYSMEFTMGDVPADGVLSYRATYATLDAFTAHVLESTPCGDPYSRGRGNRVAVTMGFIALAAAICGTGLIVADRWFRRRAGMTGGPVGG